MLEKSDIKRALAGQTRAVSRTTTSLGKTRERERERESHAFFFFFFFFSFLVRRIPFLKEDRTL